MGRIDALRYYGLRTPYDFRVAIPFLLNFVLIILLSLFFLFILSQSELHFGTYRFYFFLYVFVLLCLGAAISRFTLVSLLACVWCTIELAIAVASYAFDTYGDHTRLLPLNQVVVINSAPIHKYHPILGYVHIPNSEYKFQLDKKAGEALIKEGWLINLSNTDGRELVIHYNSMGLRGYEPGPTDLDKKLIFVYGGSTTYDPFVTQGQTWTEELQAILGTKFTILNFGLQAHSTVQHLIETAFYQHAQGRRPVCALYYVGWNEIAHAYKTDLDPAYTDYFTLLVVARKPSLWVARFSPIMAFTEKLIRKRFDSVPEVPPLRRDPTVGLRDSRLEQYFIEHISAIEAINRSRGIKTIFIGQIMNRDILSEKPSGTSYAFPLIQSGDVWPLQERFNILLREWSIKNGAQYIDAGVDHFRNDDFVDWGHFSADGSKKFATLIAGKVDSHCR